MLYYMLSILSHVSTIYKYPYMSSTMSNLSKGKEQVTHPSTLMRLPKWQYWVPPGDVYLKKARWDSENTKLFLELVAEEVSTNRRGEAPILTKEGYSNVSRKFYERTQIYLEQRQLKNKYDLLKKGLASKVFSRESQVRSHWDWL